MERKDADLSTSALVAIATMRAMIVATTAVVHDSLTEEQLERRRALLNGPPRRA